MNRNKCKQYVVLFLSVIFIIGCSPFDLEEDIVTLEHYGMVGVLGFDLTDEGGTKMTVSIPQYNEEAEQLTQTFTVEGRLPHETIIRFSSRSEKILTFDQLRTVLFSEDFAREKGLGVILKTLYRDPSIGTNVRIGVVKGSVEELLNKKYSAHPETSNYLRQLLKPRTATAFNPFTSLHDFIFRMTDQISDPSTPYLEIVKDSVDITKVAIFEEDKMIDTVVPEDAKIVEGMKHRKRIPDIVELIKEVNPDTNKDEDVMVILKFVDAQYDTTSNGNSEDPKIHAHLYIRGIINNYEGYYNLEKMSERKELEKKIEDQIEGRMAELIKTFQEQRVDPLGLGYTFRFRYKGGDWEKELWKDIFNRAEVTVNSKVTIVSTGVMP